jgi:hypothetical protein
MRRLFSQFVSVNRHISTKTAKMLPGFFARPSSDAILLTSILESIKREMPQVIIEVGGVDRPQLKKSEKYQFIGVDIDDRPDCYKLYDRFIIQSVENPLPVKADMIISLTLLEHVPNNLNAITSMYNSLNSGGNTFHYIPSKWHPYAICLRVAGPTLQRCIAETEGVPRNVC